MLTEIEWWGGMLFIWAAAAYCLAFKEYKRKLNVDFISFNLTFVSLAIVLALYFYSLDSVNLKKIYLAALLTGLLSGLIMTFWPAADEEINPSDDDEDDELIYNLLGYLIFYFPLLVSLSLGFYKSVDIVNALGLITWSI